MMFGILRRINKTRSMSSERPSNGELHSQFAQSLHRAINHNANQTETNDNRSGASSRESRTGANEKTVLKRSSVKCLKFTACFTF